MAKPKPARNAILETLARFGPLTRAELVVMTGRPPMVISTVCYQLERAGLIQWQKRQPPVARHGLVKQYFIG